MLALFTNNHRVQPGSGAEGSREEEERLQQPCACASGTAFGDCHGRDLKKKRLAAGEGSEAASPDGSGETKSCGVGEAGGTGGMRAS
jgi:hypothetical protein